MWVRPVQPFGMYSKLGIRVPLLRGGLSGVQGRTGAFRGEGGAPTAAKAWYRVQP